MRIFLFLIFLIFQKSYAQNKDDLRTMIDSAIIMAGDELHKYYENGIIVNDKVESLYVIDGNNRPYVVENKEGKINFKTIDIFSRSNRKLLKKGIYLWKVSWLLKENTLTVSIIDFRLDYESGTYNFFNGGGSKIIYYYNCDSSGWELSEFEKYGI